MSTSTSTDRRSGITQDGEPRAKRQSRRWIRLAPLALIAAVALQPASLAKKRGLQIEPGPTVMSDEEKAIQADPAAGIEHAVILVEETFRDEDLGSAMETTFHVRAKILSNEGRDLANIEIPITRHDSTLKKWWGRTILPDGTVHDLPKNDLDRQLLARSGNRQLDAVKAALPGVVPGCIIDFGYVLREAGLISYDRIELQRDWPIRRFEFEWKPYSMLQGAYRLFRTDLLDVNATSNRGLVKVSGRNLPPVIEEPLMPPDHEVRGSLVLYYIPYGMGYDTFWDDTARFMDRMARSAAKKKRSVEAAMSEMGIAPGNDPRESLVKAYNWIGNNIVRTGLRTFEEVQGAAEDDEDTRDPVGQVMEARQGSALDIQLLFIAIAKALGAEGNLVLASDRRFNVWHRELRTWNQFDATLAAVRIPDQEGFTIVDPGSEMPYGEIPWWLTGASAVVLTKARAHPVTLPTADAKKNVAESTVSISFADDNDTMVTRWTETGKGQVGLGERRYLRRLSPDDRAERVDLLCGASPDVEIVKADVVGIDDLSHGLELHCELERYGTTLEEDIGVYYLEWGGPWLRELPDLPEGPRTHPVVFEFPRVDVVNLEIVAPEGYVPEDAPEPEKLQTPVGNYVLRVSRLEDRFKVERAVALFNLAIPVDRYDELRSFIEDVRRLDRSPLTFKRAELEP